MLQVTNADALPPGSWVPSPIREPDDEFLHVAAHGLHTVSLAHREGDVEEFEDAFAGPTWDISTGESVTYGCVYERRWLCHTGTGLRLDLKRHPRGFLLAASGNASALLAQDHTHDGLVPVARLGDVERAIRQQAGRMGVCLPRSSRLAVHRADLATDLGFDPAFGLDVLRAFAALPVSRHEAETHAISGFPAVKKAVKWRRGERIQMQAYDRGRARGTAPPGTLVRLERQYRPRPRDQMTVAEFGEADLATIYAAPLGSYANADVVVVPSWAMADALLQARAGSDAKALSHLGTLVRVTTRGDEAFADRATARRRIRDLRQIGVIVADGVQAEVPLGAVIDAYVRPWGSW